LITREGARQNFGKIFLNTKHTKVTKEKSVHSALCVLYPYRFWVRRNQKTDAYPASEIAFVSYETVFLKKLVEKNCLLTNNNKFAIIILLLATK